MIGIMLSRPRGLWPTREHGRDITPETLPVSPHAHLTPAEQIPPPVTSIVQSAK